METVIRVTILFVFVLVSLRILGKRELAEMSPFDLVMIMLIPELATQALSRDDYSMTNALVGISTLLTLAIVTSLLSYRFKSVQKIIDGEPAVLVSEGKLIMDKMHKERITSEEIMEQMRAAGIENFSQLKWAVIETDGRLTVVPFHGANPNGPEDRKRLV